MDGRSRKSPQNAWDWCRSRVAIIVSETDGLCGKEGPKLVRFARRSTAVTLAEFAYGDRADAGGDGDRHGGERVSRMA